MTLSNPHGLTPREQQTVELLVDYHSPKEVAVHLSVSQAAVSHWISGAKGKFGAHSTGELCRRARLLAVAEGAA